MFIGISGKMGTGKDYIIENYIKPYIETKLNKKCLILSFADMIKVNLLQLEGTEKGKNMFGADIWVNYVKAWGELYMSRCIDFILIPDVRFKNEYDFIKNSNGIIFRINAPNRYEKKIRNESLNNENYEKI